MNTLSPIVVAYVFGKIAYELFFPQNGPNGDLESERISGFLLEEASAMTIAILRIQVSRSHYLWPEPGWGDRKVWQRSDVHERDLEELEGETRRG